MTKNSVLFAQQIKEIIAEKVLKELAPSGNEVVLKESNIMQVSVIGVPADAVVINLNRIGSLSGIERGSWKQSCDYMILFRLGEQDSVLFVELKKTVRDLSGHEQLRRSLPILDYLNRMCAIHFKTDIARPEVRYVLIGERGSARLDKQRIRPGQEPQVDDHENIKVTSVLGPSVAFGAIWPA